MQWPNTQHNHEENLKTVHKALRWMSERLSQNNFEHPDSNAEQLLRWVLGCRRVDLHLHPDRKLSHQQTLTLKELLEKRLSHTPLQYILGSSPFLDFDLSVNEHVFIPRPETEILVEETIKKLRAILSIHKRAVIIDLCTGCGNIAIALAKAFPQVQILATDISPKALSVAVENTRSHGLSDCISFLCGDLLKPLHKERCVDAVVCNPPYIVTSEISGLPREVRNFEPHLALDGGEDGLDILKRVIDEAPLLLKEEGLLALEVGQGQAHFVCQFMIDEQCFQGIEVIKDLSGTERVVFGMKVGT